MGRLAQLSQLHDQGVLTNDEFAQVEGRPARRVICAESAPPVRHLIVMLPAVLLLILAAPALGAILR